MFKRTAVPPVGPSDHQARQPLNMALGFSSDNGVWRSVGPRAVVFEFLNFGVLRFVSLSVCEFVSFGWLGLWSLCSMRICFLPGGEAGRSRLRRLSKSRARPRRPSESSASQARAEALGQKLW